MARGKHHAAACSPDAPALRYALRWAPASLQHAGRTLRECIAVGPLTTVAIMASSLARPPSWALVVLASLLVPARGLTLLPRVPPFHQERHKGNCSATAANGKPEVGFNGWLYTRLALAVEAAHP